MAALTALVIATSGSQAFTWGAQPLAAGGHAAAASTPGPGPVPPGPVSHAGQFGQPFPQPSPPAVVQPILRQGEPAPHLPVGTTARWMDVIGIDGAGNVLFGGILDGPGITESNDPIDYYASNDDTQIFSRESMQAPGMPAGVIIASLLYTSECLAENGTVAVVPGLSGPGLRRTARRPRYTRHHEQLVTRALAELSGVRDA